MALISVAASQYQPVSDEAEATGNREHFENAGQLSIPRKAVPISRPSLINDAVTDSLDQQAPSNNMAQKESFSLIRTWWLEISSCLLFLAAFVSIIATVHTFSGKRPPNWRYGLTLNAFISIELVILKAAMLLVVAEGLGQLKWSWFGRERILHDLTTYESASRGPWGALLLLLKLRGRQVVSCIGAFVTLATLIIDPFVQQLVSTENCDVVILNTNATISRTNYFNESSYTGADGSSASIGLQNAVNAGIYSPGAVAAFGCLTGNCTFSKPYSTFGYCGGCVDLTNNLTVKNITSGTSEPQTGFNISLLPDPAATSTASTSILTVGANPTVFTLNSYSDAETDIIALFLVPESASCAGNFGTIEEDRRNLTWGCGDLGLSLPSDNKNPNPAVGAARCSLSPCVRTYTASIINGTFNEHLISDSGDTSFGTSASVFDVKCLSREEYDALTNKGYDLNGKSWVPNNTTSPYQSGFDYNSSHISISYGCIYGYAPVAVQNLNIFLNSWLSGQLSYESPVTRAGPAVLQAIYNSEDLTFERLDQTWRNMSQSITTYMREHGAGNSGAGFSYSDPALGEVHTDQSCIRVQWLYIIYPAILVALAVVFFVAMLFETSHSKTDVDWKSSPLALIFHGLDRSTTSQTDENSNLVRIKDMEEVARKMAVKLSQTESGWKLVQIDKDIQMHEASH
jgi:hypothetical protein